MNKQELTTIIRNIVREEVERALPNVLVEILASKINQGVITEHSGPTTQQIQRRAVSAKPQTPVERPQMKFSTNPVLNKILNETQGGIPGDTDVGSGVLSEMPNAGGGQTSILDKIKTIPQSQLNENKEVAGVFKALNKDFRHVVRAMDKASGRIPQPNFKMSPGMFDSTE